MGWTCQHDFKGFCKLLKIDCIPGQKGCTLQKSKKEGITFTTGSFEQDKKIAQQNSNGEQQIDFAALARSH